jgi:hypothetical protein
MICHEKTPACVGHTDAFTPTESRRSSDLELHQFASRRSA